MDPEKHILLSAVENVRLSMILYEKCQIVEQMLNQNEVFIFIV